MGEFQSEIHVAENLSSQLLSGLGRNSLRRVLITQLLPEVAKLRQISRRESACKRRPDSLRWERHDPGNAKLGRVSRYLGKGLSTVTTYHRPGPSPMPQAPIDLNYNLLLDAARQSLERGLCVADEMQPNLLQDDLHRRNPDSALGSRTALAATSHKLVGYDEVVVSMNSSAELDSRNMQYYRTSFNTHLSDSALPFQIHHTHPAHLDIPSIGCRP